MEIWQVAPFNHSQCLPPDTGQHASCDRLPSRCTRLALATPQTICRPIWSMVTSCLASPAHPEPKLGLLCIPPHHVPLNSPFYPSSD